MLDANQLNRWFQVQIPSSYLLSKLLNSMKEKKVSKNSSKRATLRTHTRSSAKKSSNILEERFE